MSIAKALCALLPTIMTTHPIARFSFLETFEVGAIA
jgi:hypothetical protein